MKTKERPILMSGPMVRACLAGTKMQTRRVVNELPCQCDDFDPEEVPKMSPEGWQLAGHSGRWWCKCCTSNDDIVACPYGQPGDRLWVRETWNTSNQWQSMRPRDLPEGAPIFYAADYGPQGLLACKPWNPSIFLPRWACRLELEIVAVRVERLQEIEADDCACEGLQSTSFMPPLKHGVIDGYLHAEDQEAVKGGFQALWESINGPGSWALNPWVWVVEFRRVRGEVGGG